MIRGASFNSVTDEGILYLRFPYDGKHVAATIGDRNDAVAAPIWYWAIGEDGRLVLSDNSGETCASLELIEYSPTAVVVRNRGEIIHYNRKKK